VLPTRKPRRLVGRNVVAEFLAAGEARKQGNDSCADCAIEFYFMQPLRSRRSLLDQLGKPRRDETWKGRVASGCASARRTGLDGPGGRAIDDTRNAGTHHSRGAFSRQPQYTAAFGHQPTRLKMYPI
jgi:hypothetical protein